MAFVQLSHISVAFGNRDILSDVTLNLNTRSRTALSGSNGSGKSTLMKIIAGLINPDNGTVTYQRNTRIGYLPQDGLTYEGKTLFEESDTAFNYLHSVVDEMEKTAEKMQKSSEGDSKTDQLIELHHELQEILLAGNYYNRKEQIQQVLNGLGFKQTDLEKNCNEFSGGWQMRIALAKVLLSRPDILLLDEPTNYLDLEARNWLEKFLKDFKGGVLIVSHDRYFLDITVNEVIELFNSKLKRYKGNYSSYEKTRRTELETLTDQYKRQQEEIAKHEDFINRFRSNASKATLVQSRIKYLEKLTLIEIPENLKKIHFKFPDPPHCGKQVLQIQNLSKAYGEQRIFNNFSIDFTRGEKVVISGVNGAGKTTLLRILAGEDTSYSGEIRLGTGVELGYFSQDTNRFQNKTHSVLKELESTAPTHLIPHLRSMLGAFLFRNDDIYKSLSVLSGGEKSRLALLELLLFPVNLLILDEPTNHLDMHSKDILLDALKAYSGTLIFVSHDRYFIENLATRVIDLSIDGPKDYPGDYSYFLWKKENHISNNDTNIRTVNNTGDNKSLPEGKQSHLEHKQIKNRLGRLKKEEENLLETLENLEREYKKIEKSLADPENYSNGTRAKELKFLLDENLAKQEEINLRWEETDNEIKRLEKND